MEQCTSGIGRQDTISRDSRYGDVLSVTIIASLLQAAVQPGSLDSEAGIFQMKFDQSGSRLITCEADKTIKVEFNYPSTVNYLSLPFIRFTKRMTLPLRRPTPSIGSQKS